MMVRMCLPAVAMGVVIVFKKGTHSHPLSPVTGRSDEGS